MSALLTDCALFAWRRLGRALRSSLARDPLVAELHEIAKTDALVLRRRLDAPDVLRRLLARAFGRREQGMRDLALVLVVRVANLHQLVTDLGDRQGRPSE